MAYDEELAERIREVLAVETGLTERKMFGGIGFMINGNMAAAAGSKGGLMLRIDPARADELVDDVHVRRQVMRGKPMDGWLDVDAEAIATDEQLAYWVERGRRTPGACRRSSAQPEADALVNWASHTRRRRAHHRRTRWPHPSRGLRTPGLRPCR